MKNTRKVQFDGGSITVNPNKKANPQDPVIQQKVKCAVEDLKLLVKLQLA